MIQSPQVDEAQEAWAKAIVHIGNADSWEEARERAENTVRELYVLNDSLLFCPTKAADAQFRRDLEGAISYFVGRNEKYPEDMGFALEPWIKVRFENTGVFCKEDMALAMGNYYFTTRSGAELKVEFSFAYVDTEDGKLKIQLHHSALPYVR